MHQFSSVSILVKEIFFLCYLGKICIIFSAILASPLKQLVPELHIIMVLFGRIKWAISTSNQQKKAPYSIDLHFLVQLRCAFWLGKNFIDHVFFHFLTKRSCDRQCKRMTFYLFWQTYLGVTALLLSKSNCTFIQVDFFRIPRLLPVGALVLYNLCNKYIWQTDKKIEWYQNNSIEKLDLIFLFALNRITIRVDQTLSRTQFEN